ncbi:hypothetical protein, partial [Mesorhizobium sp. M8A.F.Ca.ET.213.01.1.1]|uniref:hypothetical protein n=1 Tax=Mesorhizobium sp. M8A.F.Ca.ET.213.01.1.1 TaxID=2563970 RepID=UPI001AEEE63F
SCPSAVPRASAILLTAPEPSAGLGLGVGTGGCPEKAGSGSELSSWIAEVTGCSSACAGL